MPVHCDLQRHHANNEHVVALSVLFAPQYRPAHLYGEKTPSSANKGSLHADPVHVMDFLGPGETPNVFFFSSLICLPQVGCLR